MKRSDKFRQANREALATVLATIAVIIFWCLAGFGLADSNITFWHTPLWVWGGCEAPGFFGHRRYRFFYEEGFCSTLI